MLRLPVQLEGAYGSEGGEDGVEDIEVDIVAKIDPNANEEGKPGHDDGMMRIVEGFGRLVPTIVSLAVLFRAGKICANN